MDGATLMTPESGVRIALALRMIGRAKSLVEAVGAMVALRRVLLAEGVDVDQIATLVENWGAVEDAIDSAVQAHADDVVDEVDGAVRAAAEAKLPGAAAAAGWP